MSKAAVNFNCDILHHFPAIRPVESLKIKKVNPFSWWINFGFKITRKFEIKIENS